MTDQEINVEIAKVCGWDEIVFRGIMEPRERDFIGTHPSCAPEGATGKWCGRIPDYVHDLNAMHDAEKKLTHKQGVHYRLLLSRNSDGRKAVFLTVEQAMCHATARQRAEAFLKTLGKWRDE